MEKINCGNTKERLCYIINEMTDHTSSIEIITSQIHDVILQAAEPCKKKIQLSGRCSSLKQSQWYDTDCSNIRHKYNRLRNTYNRSKDIEDKLKRDEARTNYKNICKVKFHTYQDQQTKALYREKYNDPKSYWKKIKPRNQKVKAEVSLHSFKEHFKSLYTLQPSISPIGMSAYNMYVDELDTLITMSEVETAIHHLKPDKAAGDDNIRSEFILYGSESLKSSILVLFNKLYDTSFYPEIWSTGVIVPIYKKGDPKEPANYRGITLSSTMSKLFTYILNQRLSSWFEQSGAASQAQFAYKKKNSTADAVQCLCSVLSYRIH